MNTAITAEVAATVDAAPAALDTLNELAAALGDDANFASTMTTSLAGKADQSALDSLQTQVNTHPLYSTLGDLPDATANHGMFAHVHSEGAAYYAHAGSWVKLTNDSDLDAETTRATSAETVNNQAIAILQNQVSGISTSSGSTDIKMTAEVDMDSNNIKNANDVYAARGFIDTIETDSLKVETGTATFEGSTVNFGSATVFGSGIDNAIKTEFDSHINVSTAGTNEFLKWNGSDYEFTDYIQGRLASDNIDLDNGGSFTAGVSATLDFQNGLVKFDGSEVIVDTPTSATHAANKSYVDSVVAATVDAAPDALNTLNELAAALGDDANFASTVTTSIASKADQSALDAEAVTRSNLGSQLLGYININGSAITTETTARESAITSAIATASADATTKADAAEADAIATASADATSKSNAAQSAAISTASSDATAKANAAQSAAEATASADATTKADAAQAAAAADATTKADAALASAQTYADNAASTAVGNVIDAAPASLDTLNELAAALGDDANFASTVTASLATKANTADVATAAQGVKADSALQPGDAVGLTVDNSDKLDGQQSSHFRIDIYDINGNIVN